MKLSLYEVYILFSGFSVIFPIIIGALYFRYFNKSLKSFWYWLLFYLGLSSITTLLAFRHIDNTSLFYLNTFVSFGFLYYILAPHWQNQRTKTIATLILGLVWLVIVLDYLHVFHIPNIAVSDTFQTLCWFLLSYYYMVRLFNSEHIKSLRQYPMFWLIFANTLSSAVSLIYYFLMGAAIKFSWNSYLKIENILYSMVLIKHIMYIVGFLKTKFGIRDIIKV